MDELNKAVTKAFANTFVYYYKAHAFHWNLRDKDFPEFHGFFGDLWEEVFEAVDPFAEKIRTLQTDVPSTMGQLIDLANITEQPNVIAKDLMVAELLSDGETIINSLREAYNLCDLYGKFGFENFLAERIDAHEKHNWMLRSSM